jgi:hypothetical protein
MRARQVRLEQLCCRIIHLQACRVRLLAIHPDSHANLGRVTSSDGLEDVTLPGGLHHFIR